MFQLIARWAVGHPGVVAGFVGASLCAAILAGNEQPQISTVFGVIFFESSVLWLAAIFVIAKQVKRRAAVRAHSSAPLVFLFAMAGLLVTAVFDGEAFGVGGPIVGFVSVLAYFASVWMTAHAVVDLERSSPTISDIAVVFVFAMLPIAGQWTLSQRLSGASI